METEPGTTASVRLIATDVDGVLTDGGIIYGSGDIELKRFHVTDGLAVRLAKLAGLKVAVITVRRSEAVRRRCSELKVDFLVQGTEDKWPVLSEILEKTGIHPRDVAYIGDDLVDIPVLQKVGYPVAVGDAVNEVKAVARYVTERRGGDGAVRQAVEHILNACGLWEHAIARYMEEITGKRNASSE
jgi:3-deoxy-D-manno-octulosonate 8-phosphate phosphatase (KDO 8-P phosphatase)